MASMGRVRGLKVYTRGKKPKRIGEVRHVLVAPDRAVVVGFEVDRPDIALMIERKSRFLALDRAEITADDIHVPDERGAWDSSAARRLGVDWDETVVWRSMPVRSEDDEPLGKVYDATFNTLTGEITSLRLSSGAVADGAIGVRDCSADLVVGFDGESIVLKSDAEELASSGGAAKAAGKGAAVATVMAGEVATQASERMGELAQGAARAAGTAAAYTRSAAKAAARSDAGKKTIGWLKSLKDEVIDAMGPPDEDD